MSNKETLEEIADELHEIMQKANKRTKVVTLYACNSIGKTRLTKFFCDKFEEENVHFYSDVTEDSYSWSLREESEESEESYVLNLQEGSEILQPYIRNPYLLAEVNKSFKKFTELPIEPTIITAIGQITFAFGTTDAEDKEKRDGSEIGGIKISRGEESVFIWSVYYTVLKAAIESLNQNPNDPRFNKLKYAVIDDPVSSIDDARIITIALELADLISTSKSDLQFIITTHHSLFFNVMFNSGGANRKYYTLEKSENKFALEALGTDSPFAYHHLIISEIERAINEGSLQKFHFNQFRTLLEKTANFLGCTGGWEVLLTKFKEKRTFIKTLNHYSHDKLSDLDARALRDEEKKEFGEVFSFFMQEFRWYLKNLSDSADFFYTSAIPYKFVVPGIIDMDSSFKLNEEHNIVGALRDCCEQAIVSKNFDSKSVSVENHNILLLQIRLIDARGQDISADHGIVVEFQVPFMQYLGKVPDESNDERLYFAKLQWDEKDLLQFVKLAVMNYEFGGATEYRIKEFEASSTREDYRSSKLFAGNIRSNAKKIWISASKSGE